VGDDSGGKNPMLLDLHEAFHEFAETVGAELGSGSQVESVKLKNTGHYPDSASGRRYVRSIEAHIAVSPPRRLSTSEERAACRKIDAVAVTFLRDLTARHTPLTFRSLDVSWPGTVSILVDIALDLDGG
jgi:hypothetical protein